MAISCSQMEALSAPPPLPTQSPGNVEAALMKSIKEALFLTAVSWEGNWNNNKPSHLFKGLVAGTPPSALWEGSCSSAGREMTVPIREIPFRTLWTGWEHPPHFTDDQTEAKAPSAPRGSPHRAHFPRDFRRALASPLDQLASTYTRQDWPTERCGRHRGG